MCPRSTSRKYAPDSQNLRFFCGCQKRLKEYEICSKLFGGGQWALAAAAAAYWLLLRRLALRVHSKQKKRMALKKVRPGSEEEAEFPQYYCDDGDWYWLIDGELWFFED